MVSREEISVWYDLKTELARNVFDDAIEYVTNFTIKTANGYARTKELFKKKKKDPTIRKWSSNTSNENWTMVSFKPRLGRLDMKRIDDVSLLIHEEFVDDAKPGDRVQGCGSRNISETTIQLKPSSKRRTSTWSLSAGKGNHSRGEAALPVAVKSFLSENEHEKFMMLGFNILGNQFSYEHAEEWI
ncbi:hypothetical protein Tco_1465575 [Tanacetum coccineum]